jgi:hypothetical protein
MLRDLTSSCIIGIWQLYGSCLVDVKVVTLMIADGRTVGQWPLDGP